MYFIGITKYHASKIVSTKYMIIKTTVRVTPYYIYSLLHYSSLQINDRQTYYIYYNIQTEICKKWDFTNLSFEKVETWSSRYIYWLAGIVSMTDNSDTNTVLCGRVDNINIR